jgi:hypothetical protein
MCGCAECFSDPCECGYEYELEPTDWLIEMRDLFDRLVKERMTRLLAAHERLKGES